MASNYWESTQRKNWEFTKAQLQECYRRLEEKERMLVSQYPLPDRRLLNIYFSIQLGKLAKRMSIRQQALATAQVYMRRYFTVIDMRRTNPYLVLTTCFYLACKVEECPHHIRLVAAEARQLWPDMTTSEPSQLGECEYSIISELNSQLILHHPYRTLTDLQSAKTLGLTLDETSLAWNIINDHYLTDLPLCYSPHLVALTAAFMAVALKPIQGGGMHSQASAMQSALNSALASSNPSSSRIQKVINWIAESQVDIKDMIDLVQELISLYEVWDSYKESVCKDPIARFVKTRALDN